MGNEVKKVYITAFILIMVGLLVWYTYNFMEQKKRMVNTFISQSYKLKDSNYKSTVKIELKGTYHKKDEMFTGSLTLNDQHFDYCILASGFPVICYDSGVRTLLGPFNAESGFDRFTIEIDHPQTYLHLTNEPLVDGERLIIVQRK